MSIYTREGVINSNTIWRLSPGREAGVLNLSVAPEHSHLLSEMILELSSRLGGAVQPIAVGPLTSCIRNAGPANIEDAINTYSEICLEVASRALFSKIEST